MDDDLLVYRDDATRDRTLRQMKALGVDSHGIGRGGR